MTGYSEIARTLLTWATIPADESDVSALAAALDPTRAAVRRLYDNTEVIPETE